MTKKQLAMSVLDGMVAEAERMECSARGEEDFYARSMYIAGMLKMVRLLELLKPAEIAGFEARLQAKRIALTGI